MAVDQGNTHYYMMAVFKTIRARALHKSDILYYNLNAKNERKKNHVLCRDIFEIFAILKVDTCDTTSTFFVCVAAGYGEQKLVVM